MTAAFWIDEDGTEYEIDSSRPGAPGWSVVHFVDEAMALSMVQNRHIVVREQRDTPGAAATASEGLESVTHQEEESMSNFTPTAAEIVEAAIARNFGTLTLGQAEAIRREQRFNQSNMYVITPFVAPDACRMLTLRDTTSALKMVDDEDKRTLRRSDTPQLFEGIAPQVQSDKASPPDRMSPPDIPSPPDRMCLAHALITASDLLSQHGGR